MGPAAAVSLSIVPRVVSDANVFISTLLFRNGRLAWLRSHWREKRCVPLLSRASASELNRILSYPKFRLSAEQHVELHGFYLPYCDTTDVTESCPVVCRDAKDQIFLDLAQSGRADILVSGYQDLLVLRGQTTFAIETPEEYRNRVLKLTARK